MGSGVVNLYLQTQTKADSGVGEREGVHRVGASGLDMAPVVYATTPPTEPPPPQIQTQQKPTNPQKQIQQAHKQT
jgi:hypothetical protein